MKEQRSTAQSKEQNKSPETDTKEMEFRELVAQNSK